MKTKSWLIISFVVILSMNGLFVETILSQEIDYGKDRNGTLYYRYCYPEECTSWMEVPSSSGSQLTIQEVMQILEVHNQIRAVVGNEPLIWSSDIAMYAQEWVNHLAVTTCSLSHRPSFGEYAQQYGENAFMGTLGHYGVKDAMRSWEQEKSDYEGQTINAENYRIFGHYTQLIWDKSVEIGCGKAACYGRIIIFCNYDPAGNTIGERPY